MLATASSVIIKVYNVPLNYFTHKLESVTDVRECGGIREAIGAPGSCKIYNEVELVWFGVSISQLNSTTALPNLQKHLRAVVFTARRTW